MAYLLQYIIHFKITCFIIKSYCKRRLNIQDLHSVLSARTHIALHRAHGALEVPTALSNRPYSALLSALCNRKTAAMSFVHVQMIAAAWRPWRWYSAYTVRIQRCCPLHSAQFGYLQLFGRCGNTLRTPLWCVSALNEQIPFENMQ